MVDYEKLVELGEKYSNFSCRPPYPKIKEGTIFDEEKSVRWNREEVIRRNAARDEEVKSLNREKANRYQEFVSLVKKYIQENTSSRVSDERAGRIWDYLESNYHSYGISECLAHLDDLLELF